MGTVTHTIGTSSRNYSTLQAWEDAIPADLVADGNSYVGECYNDSEFTARVSIAGHTTSSSNTITLTCATGQSFSDNASVQSNALRYNQANGVGLLVSTDYGSCIDTQVAHVTISKMQMKASGFQGRAVVSSSGDAPNVHWHRNILQGRVDNNGAFNYVVINNGRFGKFTQNVVIASAATTGGGGLKLTYQASTEPIVGNTFVVPSDRAAGTNGVLMNANVSATLTNNAVFGFATSFANTGTALAGSNNASDVTIGFGTSNQASKTYANQFQNTTNASLDLRLKTGADCIDNGVTDSVNGTPDIAGTTRPVGAAYDIGAWELAASAPRFILGTH